MVSLLPIIARVLSSRGPLLSRMLLQGGTDCSTVGCQQPPGVGAACAQDVALQQVLPAVAGVWEVFLLLH